MNFSDYIVYVDESGDHSLTSINPQNPVFVLVFCVFESDFIDVRSRQSRTKFRFGAMTRLCCTGMKSEAAWRFQYSAQC